jgi:aspartate aminotransferase
MSLVITERMKKIKPSPTLALSAKAQELAASGLDVISLTVGEPDWNTIGVARKAALDAIEKGHTKYTPAGGMLPLRKTIAAQFKKDFGVEYSPEEISVSAGGKFVIHAVMESLINQGDEVIIPAPYWVSYPTLVEMAGGKPVFVSCAEANRFKILPAQLDQAITPKTKMLIMNSPSNPTGQTYSDRELKALGEVLLKHPHVLILTDDIYNHLYFGADVAPHILKHYPELKSRTIVVNGSSKSFSMTGWRVGWAMAPKELIASMNKYITQTVSCANSVAQHATLAALELGVSEVSATVEDLKARMAIAMKAIREVPGLHVEEPTGAFYFWIRVSDCFKRKFGEQVINNSAEFSALLLEKENVAVVPGNEFGMEGYIRASFAVSSKRMLEAIGRMSRFVSNLR